MRCLRMVICCHFTKVIRNVKSDRVVTCVFIILRMNKVKYRNKNVLITTRSYKYFATMQRKDNKAFTALLEIYIYTYTYMQTMRKMPRWRCENFHEHVIELRQVKKCHCLCKLEMKDILDRLQILSCFHNSKWKRMS